MRRSITGSTSGGTPGALDRRTVLTGAAGALAASLLRATAGAAEPPPETRTIRLVHAPILCLAPQFIAEDLLRAEGFTEVEYVKWSSGTAPLALVRGQADISMWEAPATIPLLEQAPSLVALAGVHAGCIEIFGGKSVRTLRDLRGKTIAVSERGGTEHVFLSSTLAYVGVDPRKDVSWVETGSVETTRTLFTEGKSDAFFAFPPAPQELRAKKIGRVILDTLRDRPWSQYFCCAVFGNREWVTAHPVAAKRAIRAILKAADICSLEPARAARYMVVKGYETRPEIALELIRSLPFRKWREDSLEDTLRFYGLRLYEVGIVKTHPNKLIAQSTDWRFVNEIKKELKA